MNISPNLIVKVFFVLLYAYIAFRLFKYFKIYTLYMLNEKFVWDKEVDNPRLYVHSLFLPVSLIFCSQVLKEEELSPIIIGVKVFFFLVSVLMIWFCHFTWNEKFETIFLPKIKETIKRKSSRNHTFDLDKEFVNYIFNEFLKFELLPDGTKFEEFHDALIFSEERNIKIKFNMTAIEFRCFFDLLKSKSRKKVFLTSYIKGNSMIYTKNGEAYKYDTLKDCKLEKANSEKAFILKEIFENTPDFTKKTPDFRKKHLINQ